MKTLLLIAALCSTAAYADDANWTTVAGNDEAQLIIKFKNHSCTTDSGVIKCLGQISNHGTLWVGYIGTTTACVKGYGRIIDVSLDGGTILDKIDVAAGGESVGSVQFDFLCALAAKAT